MSQQFSPVAVGELVRYEGSAASQRGLWFTVAYGPGPGYVLKDDYGTSLTNVRRSSFRTWDDLAAAGTSA